MGCVTTGSGVLAAQAAVHCVPAVLHAVKGFCMCLRQVGLSHQLHHVSKDRGHRCSRMVG
jgi:hypothetical protein